MLITKLKMMMIILMMVRTIVNVRIGKKLMICRGIAIIISSNPNVLKAKSKLILDTDSKSNYN